MSWKNEQVSRGETEKILEVARAQLGVEGDYVEMGCYRGDTSLVLAEVLRDYNRGQTVEKPVENSGEKWLWIYDSFEGLPEKSSADESALGVDFKKGELLVTKREVKERFLRAGLPVPVIKKGWFVDLASDDLPSEIALAFLDGDLYESIRDSLKLVGPKMVSGGVILVHDYSNPALPGVAKAVDEWRRGKGLKLERFESLAILRGF
ncbi:class I SAM-dependent methyltransferase [Candidatus Saccharibacteria bacterium]|nr:class I SAM-dependent methyltransferase [Candidatus Saccharibacteria bacterium]